MAGLVIFVGLCIAAVPPLIFVFVAFSRDEKHVCRCTCQVTKFKEATLVQGRATPVAVMPSATVRADDTEEPALLLHRN